MQLSKFLVVAVTIIGKIQAATLGGRQDFWPDADCCSCSYDIEGWICKVPDTDGCSAIPDTRCPFRPNEEKTLCCCCDATPGNESTECSLVDRDAGCICPEVRCLHNFGKYMLPSWVQG
ncbi:hypothetical protein CGMCC3_g15923 [Colletotrichum fructicola]|nr:uncharacterized protein CGMCC3_g15923 [Colletotrichum fructicola]KAE9567955.1 hypothetical protein CGMCC3_g15923 [Colletotrichum fructicola]